MALIRVSEPDQSMTYLFGQNNSFNLPAWPDAMADSEPAKFIDSAADALGTYLDTRETILANKHTSDFGKAEALKPKSAQVLQVMARTSGAIDKYEAARDAEELGMLAVPKLDATYAGEAAIDVEVRQWWRGLDQIERATYVSRFKGGRSDHQRVALALLRSPVSMLDDQLLDIRDGWDEYRRSANPELTEKLALARQAAENARLGVAHLVGNTTSIVRWESGQILETLLGDSNEFTHIGVKAFGFNDSDVVRARLLMEAKARKWMK